MNATNGSKKTEEKLWQVWIKMKIYIDADGCPVVDSTIKIAFENGLEAVIICDTAHSIEYEGVVTITVSQGADSADFKLVNMISRGDIIITQDYGLAAMCLGKDAYVLHQDGLEYTTENICGLLEVRAINKKIRKSGGRTRQMPKRTQSQDKDFEKALRDLIERLK